jgi:hypothetical protein
MNGSLIEIELATADPGKVAPIKQALRKHPLKSLNFIAGPLTIKNINEMYINQIQHRLVPVVKRFFEKRRRVTSIGFSWRSPRAFGCRHHGGQPAWSIAGAKEKESRPKAALNSNPMILDQAASNAALFFRRYAMNPTPAKPRIIMAQVEGSGTPGVNVAPALPVFPLRASTARSEPKKIWFPL